MKNRRRGVALAFVLFGLVILSTLGLGMLIVLLSSEKGSYAYQNNTNTLNNAMAGIGRAVVELEKNTAWAGDTENNGAIAFTVTVNSTSTLPSGLVEWYVTSKGSSGGATRTISALLAQQSFASYGYLSNNENLPSEPNQEWWITGNVVEGNSATNGFFLYYGNPAFSAKVTSANGCNGASNCGSDPAYNDPHYVAAQKKYTQSGVPDPYNNKYFYNYFSGYGTDYPVAYNSSTAFAFDGGQPYIPWPSINVSSMQAHANATYTGDVKLVLNNNGTVTVTTGGSISGGSGTAMTYTGGSSGSFTIPATGGTLFIEDGNVLVQGTLKGRLSIVTGPSSTPPNRCTTLPSIDGAPPACGNIDVENNILYHDKTQGSSSYTGGDGLGLVATGDVSLDPYSVPANVEVDGSMMAIPLSYNYSCNGGHSCTSTIHTGVGVQGYAYSCQNIKDNTSGTDDQGSGCTNNFCYTGSCPPAEGNYTLFGAMLPELGGDPVGIFNSGNGQIISGYNQIFYYDTNLANNPPPNFPVTGVIQVVQWIDSNAL